MKLLFLLPVFCSLASAHNILVVFPYPSRSHFEVYVPLFEALANRGHNLTIISYRNTPYNSENIENFWLGQDEEVNVVSLKGLGETGAFYLGPHMLAMRAEEVCEYGLQAKGFRRFLEKHQNTKFDLIMIEHFNIECFLGLVNKYKAPFIGLSSSVALPWQGKWFGAQPNPSYVQNVCGGFSTPMIFLDRVVNTLLHVYSNVWYELFIAKPANEWSKKYIDFEAADPHKTSLFLVNTHYTLTGVQPLTPNIIEVGGLHVQNRKPQKLPAHLENWITNAKAGVIYFSLGSMIRSDSFPEEQRNKFLRAFARFPQRILWKWESDGAMLDKPDNVMIDKWMPQYEILCHPNVKLFLSHGGLLSTVEAAHCGKPLVIMPQFGDQRFNAHAMETNGVATLLHLQTASEEQIVEAIEKALQPGRMQNAKALMDKFKDRPLSPMDTAIYWVEHIARHKGGEHMRSRAIDMPFYQVYLLDVIGFLVCIIFCAMFALYKTVRLILRLGRAKKVDKQKYS
ncbi:unnamed protein product [Ceutorhynchus assimilis]|uniref:UDP-glucuronosyltransferase n=1 Tax=Ceutorhynchus assimilis TaxID=467358 RepID=A0A9N9MHI0_9CUCU|nr:unnamed protein product [Ceutorhynchus assimilis]